MNPEERILPVPSSPRTHAGEANDFLLLDCVRGISAIVVCAAHSYHAFVTPVFGTQHWSYKLVNCGAYFAVLIFFVLSGLMITSSALKNVESGHGKFCYRRFLAARVARIYPPLLFALGLGILVFGCIRLFSLPGSVSYSLPGDLFLLREKVDLSVMQVVAPLLQLQSLFVSDLIVMNGSLWSLSIEVWIYLLMCFACVGHFNRNVLLGWIPCIACLLLLRDYNERFPYYAAIWLLGAGWTVARKKNLLGSRYFERSISVVAAGAAVCMVAMIPRWGLAGVLTGDGFWRLKFSCLACALLTIAAYRSRAFWLGLAERMPKLLRWLSGSADYSYTLYVIHFPLLLLAMSLVRTRLAPQPLPWQLTAWLGVTLGCIIFAWWVAPWVEDRSRIFPALERLIQSSKRRTPVTDSAMP